MKYYAYNKDYRFEWAFFIITKGFLKFIKDHSILNQEDLTLIVLYECYINSICWMEVPFDNEMPINNLKIRL